MAIPGPFTWFDESLEHVDADAMNGVDTYSAILTTTSQALSASFVGSSGNCTYADLTAELATANGYTNGGLVLTSVTVTRSGGVVKWDADNLLWTITGAGISFLYLVIRNNTTGRLICFSNVYTDGGGANLTAVAGPLQFTISPDGILEIERV